MQLVLDPGVLISAVIAPQGVCGQLLQRWLDGEFDLVVSPALLEELEEVLLRPKFRRYVTEAEAREFVHLIAASADLVADPPSTPRVTRDPGDDYLVALAGTAEVDALVAGDEDLTSVTAPVPPIVSPPAMLDRLDRAREARESGRREPEDAEPSSPAWTRQLESTTLPDESPWVSSAVRASREPARRDGSIDR